MRGFEPASGLLKARIRTAGEARGFAVTRLLTHWTEVAGHELARTTRPVKVGYTRDGMGATLTLLTSAAMAPVVQMQLPALRERVNACYGYAAISRIALTQTAATGFAEAQTAFSHAPSPTPGAAVQPRDPATQRLACATARAVADDGLRAALENLAINILSRAKTWKGDLA